MSEWQPIETAPKEPDENVLLACLWPGAKRYSVDVGFWDMGDGQWLSATNHNGYENAQLTPSYWMPLPSPPSPSR